jgi:hypothetical protein
MWGNQSWLQPAFSRLCFRTGPQSEIVKLTLNRSMFPGYADHFRAGVLHLDFAWSEADKRTAYQHQAANPDPRD